MPPSCPWGCAGNAFKSHRSLVSARSSLAAGMETTRAYSWAVGRERLRTAALSASARDTPIPPSSFTSRQPASTTVDVQRVSRAAPRRRTDVKDLYLGLGGSAIPVLWVDTSATRQRGSIPCFGSRLRGLEMARNVGRRGRETVDQHCTRIQRMPVLSSCDSGCQTPALALVFHSQFPVCDCTAGLIKHDSITRPRSALAARRAVHQERDAHSKGNLAQLGLD
ncbi:hypothetical protein C8Q77DRAFT_358197 [Trametes polyzona]|nr:hypothetical protein C8Q77DRAFT_358197 [Trametes polyzona]